MEPSRPSLFVAIPNMGWLHAGLASRIVVWTKDLGAFVLCPEYLRPTAYARNVCARRFMDSGRSHLLFVDADTLPPFDAPKLLLDAALPIVAGVVHQMKLDADGISKPVPMIARRTGRGLVPVFGNGIEQIDGCGFGCVLIQRDVFEAIEFPWFHDASWGETRGQDFRFCRRLEEAAIKLHAHFGVVCEHRKEVDL